MDETSETPKDAAQDSDTVNLVSAIPHQTSDEELKGQSVITVNLAAATTVQSTNALVDPEFGEKRREVLSRRPSYRRILNDLSSTDVIKKPTTVNEMKTKMLNEDINTGTDDMKGQPTISPFTANGELFDCSDDTNAPSAALSPEGISNSVALGDTIAACQMGQNIVTIPDLAGLRSSAILTSDSQVSLTEDANQQTMWIPGHGVVVQAIGVDGSNMQTFQLQDPSQRIGGIITTQRNMPQMTIQSPQHMVQDASRKREMRLMKNRDAAKECRRRKKEYVKCLETRVAVLEQQNQQLIEELKTLKELYVHK